MKRIFPVLFILSCSIPLCLASPVNLVHDPGFEAASDGGFSAAWTSFGNAFREAHTPHGGTFAAKLFGTFTGGNNWSGVMQDLPAEAGATYRAEVMARHNSDDALKGETTAFLKIEFYDQADKLLKAVESNSRLHSDSPTDTYLKLATPSVEAPAGTVRLRIVLLAEQHPDKGSGAAYLDDVRVEKRSP